MQSFLQYRNAGLAAKQQVERDLEKAQMITGNRGTAPVQGNGVQTAKSARLSESEPLSDNLEPHPSASLQPEPALPKANGGPNRLEDATGELHTVPTGRTHFSEGTALGHSLTGVDVRDRQTHEGTGQVFVVGWDGPDDPACPRNWSTGKRVGVTLQISLVAVAVTAASGIDVAVLPQAAADLGVSQVAESLATGLFLVGMGLGSLVAGPFSETFGRNTVYTGSLIVFMIWIMASALAPNFGAQITFRFLAGCSASTPLVCSGGSISDLWNTIEKTWGFPLYAVTCFGGPMLGSVMGAYIGPSDLVSWRWCEWVSLMFSGLTVILLLLFLPETYSPVLLQWKAAHLRNITGDERFRSEHEIVDATLFSRLRVSMTRPFFMLTEPIIIAMTLYLTVVYIVLFTFLVGWVDIFEVPYGIGQGLAHVIFISMAIGTWLTFLLVPVVYRATIKQAEASESRGEGYHFRPEMRLLYAMLGPSVAVPISLYWMAWTSSPNITIWSPILAAALFGFGVAGIFLFAYLYVIDAYEVYAASALTFVALVRYVVAGGMTVVGIPFYSTMGVPYTLTILASLSLLLVPIPYVLYKYGHLLRKKSKYAVSGDK